MLTLQQLKKYLSGLFNEPKIIDYCPNGLQVEGKKEILKIATAVSATLETIEEAIDRGVNSLIVHHGLFWTNDSQVIEGVKKKKIALLLAHEISLFGYHLPLDLHKEVGNNWRAAKDLGWKNLEPFGLFNGVPIGVKGSIPSSTFGAFQSSLEHYYQHPAKAVVGKNQAIEKVGLISGGAHKSILEAAKEELDAFVTGSFDEPTWYQAKEEGINFFAMGHSASERVGPRALAEQIQKDLNVSSFFIDCENPF